MTVATLRTEASLRTRILSKMSASLPSWVDLACTTLLMPICLRRISLTWSFFNGRESLPSNQKGKAGRVRLFERNCSFRVSPCAKPSGCDELDHSDDCYCNVYHKRIAIGDNSTSAHSVKWLSTHSTEGNNVHNVGMHFDRYPPIFHHNLRAKQNLSKSIRLRNGGLDNERNRIHRLFIFYSSP